MSAPSTVVPFRAKAPRLVLGSRDDELQRLVEGLQAGKAWAERAFVDEYRPHVARLLYKVLGASADLDDLVQETFIRALDRVDTLREAKALRSWLTSIAVFVARETIRARRRRRWLTLLPTEELPEVASSQDDVEGRAALRAFYAVLRQLKDDRQLYFALRYVEGMELGEVALACDVSLSTAKRRLQQAEAEFLRRAGKQAALAEWLGRSERWKS
ncbi:MAG: sigma-70 family RNA polymerase sigma factor [Polyangiaceae bacterium]